MINEDKIDKIVQFHIDEFKKEFPNKKAIWRDKKTKAFLLYLEAKIAEEGIEFDWKCKNLIVVKPRKYARCSLWKLQIFGTAGQECCYSNKCEDKR